jgi:hypothetical protein
MTREQDKDSRHQFLNSLGYLCGNGQPCSSGITYSAQYMLLLVAMDKDDDCGRGSRGALMV